VDDEVDDEVDDRVSVVSVSVSVSVSETELSSISPSAPPTRASRAPSSIVNITGSQLRFRYPPTYLGSAPPIGHPAFTAITTPPPCKPRNKAPIAPATKSFIMAVFVWWQHIVVVAIEAGIIGREVDVIDQEVDVLETEVDLINQDVEDQEVDVFETKVDLIDQDIDVVENEVDVLDRIVDVVDVKFEGIEFEKTDVEGQGVVDKDEFRVTGDIQEDGEVA
jgi:hypothetical protein